MHKLEDDFKPYQTRTENGGSLHGDSYDMQSLICLTRFGEVGFSMSDEGDLVADFAELGLLFRYNDEGELVMTMLDIGSYIANLGAHEVREMPHGGSQLLSALKFLQDENMDALVLIHHQEKSLEITLVNTEGKTSIIDEHVNLNYSAGVRGDIAIGESKVVFEFLDMNEDFSVSLGEGNDKKVRMVGLEFSKEIDFEDEIFGQKASRLQHLAEKIIVQ